MAAIHAVKQKFGARSRIWSFDKVLECAEQSKTYRDFYTRFPLPYKAAHTNNWLSAVIRHCGWENVNGYVGPSQGWYRVNLAEIMQDDGSIMPDAYGDATWPMELNENSALAELV